MNPFRMQRWSPYVAGALAGLLLVLSVLVTGKYIGASTTFVRTAGLIEQVFVPARVAAMEYFVKEKGKIEWQWMFVFGIFFGSLAASRIAKDYQATAVPPMWQARFGPDMAKRWAVAFAGGGILMFGARLAGG